MNVIWRMVSINCLTIDYRAHIKQVSLQLSCGLPCQTWTWFKRFRLWYRKSKIIPYGEFNERIVFSVYIISYGIHILPIYVTFQRSDQIKDFPGYEISSLIELTNIPAANMFLLTCLTHWGWVTHIYVSKITIVGSDNSLSPDRRKAIFWTNALNIVNWTFRNKLQWNLKGTFPLMRSGSGLVALGGADFGVSVFSCCVFPL